MSGQPLDQRIAASLAKLNAMGGRVWTERMFRTACVLVIWAENPDWAGMSPADVVEALESYEQHLATPEYDSEAWQEEERRMYNRLTDGGGA